MTCRWCTYRTSSVLRRPKVGGMLPVKLLLSRSLDTQYKPSTVWASQITTKIKKLLWVDNLGFLTYRCISFICELKIWLGMVPESSLIPKWLRRNGHETTTRSGDSKYPNIMFAKKKSIPISRNLILGIGIVHTSALYLSDYPARDLCHRILEVLQRAYCQPDQTSIAWRVFRVMPEWNHWTCLSS